MYSCNVGQDFKISFLKRSLNFCYDQNEGVIYTSDLETLEKLGVNRGKINEVFKRQDENVDVEHNKFITKDEVEKNLVDLTKQLVANFNDRISFVEEKLLIKIETLKKEKVLLEQTIRELVDFYKETIDVDEEKQNNQEKISSTLKNSVGILNKKIKETNETIENLKVRFEAILDLLSEHSAKTGQFPNVFKSGITIEKIWNSVQDKNSAAVLSIMLMMKKALEEKGMRLTV